VLFPSISVAYLKRGNVCVLEKQGEMEEKRGKERGRGEEEGLILLLAFRLN
jgi:hypothetical protein